MTRVIGAEPRSAARTPTPVVGNTALQTEAGATWAQQRAGGPQAQLTRPAATARDIETNVTTLQGAVGPGQANDPTDVRRVQTRLTQTGHLRPSQVNGVFDGTTAAAIRNFQRDNRSEIDRIRADSRGNLYDQGGTAGRGSRSGYVRPNDATHQALANAWPRSINGRMMTEPQAYDYLSNAVRQRTGNFDQSRVNIVGIRGYQGGGTHDNPGVQTQNNRYDDEMFVLSRTAGGQPRVRSFRATVDPGARSTAGQNRDLRTSILHPDQQIDYRVGSGNSRFQGRPAMWMQTGGGVRRSGSMHPSARTTRGNNEAATATTGIAIHSGGPGDRVQGHSTGCQIVQGSWYPGFFEEVQRGLRPENDRMISYSILDGRNLP